MWYTISLVTLIVALFAAYQLWSNYKLRRYNEALVLENDNLRLALMQSEEDLQLHLSMLDSTRKTAELDYSHMRTLLKNQEELNQDLHQELERAHANLELVLNTPSLPSGFENVSVEVSREGVIYIFKNELSSSANT